MATPTRPCPYCGAAVLMNAAACGTCGRPMPAAPGAPPAGGGGAAKTMFGYAAPVLKPGQPPVTSQPPGPASAPPGPGPRQPGGPLGGPPGAHPPGGGFQPPQQGGFAPGQPPHPPAGGGFPPAGGGFPPAGGGGFPPPQQGGGFPGQPPGGGGFPPPQQGGGFPGQPPGGGGFPPPQGGGFPPPQHGGGFPGQPPGGGGFPPPQQGGGFPPPGGGGFPPPQHGGGFPGQPAGGGFPPPQGGGFPPPGQGGFPPPQGGGFPPPQQGGGFPPPGQGGFAPPQGGGYPPPPQAGGYPPPGQGFPPPGGGGFPPPPQAGYPPPGQPGYPPQNLPGPLDDLARRFQSAPGTLFGVPLSRLRDPQLQRQALFILGVALLVSIFVPASFSPFMFAFKGNAFRGLVWPLIAGASYLLVAAAPPDLRQKFPPAVLEWLPFGVSYAGILIVGIGIGGAGGIPLPGLTSLYSLGMATLIFGLLARLQNPQDQIARIVMAIGAGLLVIPWVDHFDVLFKFDAPVLGIYFLLSFLVLTIAIATLLYLVPPQKLPPALQAIDALAPAVTALLLLWLPVQIVLLHLGFIIDMPGDFPKMPFLLSMVRSLLMLAAFFGVLMLTAPAAYDSFMRMFKNNQGGAPPPGGGYPPPGGGYPPPGGGYPPPPQQGGWPQQ